MHNQTSYTNTLFTLHIQTMLAQVCKMLMQFQLQV